MFVFDFDFNCSNDDSCLLKEQDMQTMKNNRYKCFIKLSCYVCIVISKNILLM